MKYDTRIKNGMLNFTRKSGKPDHIYLLSSSASAEDVLVELYDFHQCDDEFGPDDEIEVDGKWLFKVHEKIHIIPANEETRRAVLGTTLELPYRVTYDGTDGRSSKSFATLAEAAKYVKDRWQGVDYMDGRAAFHTDYARYTLVGFELKDIGTFGGTTNEDRYFEFKEVV